MTNTTNSNGFKKVSNLKYFSKAKNKEIEIDSEKIIEVIVNSNVYISNLQLMFQDIGFDVYETLGQRNLSGFVGEIFVRSFEKIIPDYTYNPHADGRPDILDITSANAKSFYSDDCFEIGEDGKNIPIRNKLAPFKFGGLEVKCSIGNPISKGNRKKLFENQGINNFSVGMPRIGYLQTITYWGHHANCENLIGLYYDYSETLNGSPQIMAVMHSELDARHDWNAVSIGKTGSKKTSNTSLTSLGKHKLFNNVIAVCDDKKYLEKLRLIGLSI